MVKVKEYPIFSEDGSVDLEAWLRHVLNKGHLKSIELIRNACSLAQLAGDEHATETAESCLHQGLNMADILTDFAIDEETVAAAIIFASVHYAELSNEDVALQLNPQVAKLISGVGKMSVISNFDAFANGAQTKQQIDNTRKMLIAMVDDVRVVLIKLAERLCVLRALAPMPEVIRAQIAQEAMTIYAPLANRLGIGSIKWEIEDYAFRYLQPEKYKEIAKGLKTKRIERDKFVNLIVSELTQAIKNLKLEHVDIYGRSKHIHSIYNKMRRKNVPLEEIYDATAVRILVDDKADCYELLSLVHSLWNPIPEEFDDYIIHQKPNGYQSLHTAVTGPEGRVFEVQIRTFQMHDLAEMGVAAHWKYKEGSTQEQTQERKIEWLRDVLAWHREMATTKGFSETLETEFLEDRVYVFTPNGDILDLPRNATVLDFAYHVHTDVGHRCRGAKVNGKIAPLTASLKTGDRVTVLTGKEVKPSRDWLNPHLNFLKTSRAKAKVMHWFKMQDFDKNVSQGQELLAHELKILGLKTNHLEEIAKSFNFKHVDDMLAALGRNDIKLAQIIHRIAPQEPPPTPVKKAIKPDAKSKMAVADLKVEGVGNLLTHIAQCCQPLPEDELIGYITVGRGVSIHRKDCANITRLSDKQQDRFLKVTWASSGREEYVVDVLVKAEHRKDLLRDITVLLSDEAAHVVSLDTKVDKTENLELITLALEVGSLVNLSRVLTKLMQISGVVEAKRLQA